MKRFYFIFWILFTVSLTANAQIITTIAGGKIGDGVPATAAELYNPVGVAVDGAGNVYLADEIHNLVRKVNSSGVINTFAGNGVRTYGGDGGQATASELANPWGIAIDGTGNVYIADAGNNKIRKVNSAGVVSTFAGSGVAGFLGDGGAATAAKLNNPCGVAVDALGNVYIADMTNHAISKVDASGIIRTIAGNDTSGYNGDGGAATSAKLNYPSSVVVDGSGNIYIGDQYNNRVRMVNTSGIISTFAGTGTAGYSGDLVAATAAELYHPYGLAFDATGKLYIADCGNSRIRVVYSTGIINTIAGSGLTGFSGDGSAATAAAIWSPTGVAVDSAGNIYIVAGSNRARVVNSLGIINTFAGNGIGGYSGDNGPATTAILNGPTGVAVDVNRNIYFADQYNNRIRKIDSNGLISTLAGNGNNSYFGDGGLATAAEINSPSGVAVDDSGNVYIADGGNNCIRKVNNSGIITTIAGTGTFGYSGDGGPATAAELNGPWCVAVDGNGNVFIADTYNQRLRKVNNSGIISTIAGIGTVGFSGDGGVATAAEISYIYSIAVDDLGDVFISDESNKRIRKVDSSGIISTIAGNGVSGFLGDGGMATLAELSSLTGIAIDGSGNIYIADAYNRRIRKVNSTGLITTIAGDGIIGYSGDGGLATAAELGGSWSVAVDAGNNVYFSDTWNECIRKVNGIPTKFQDIITSIGNIVISPIPCTGIFSIILKSNTNVPAQFIITNIEGRIVMEFSGVSNKEMEINTNLPSGLYFVSVATNKDRYFGKFAVLK